MIKDSQYGHVRADIYPTCMTIMYVGHDHALTHAAKIQHLTPHRSGPDRTLMVM